MDKPWFQKWLGFGYVPITRQGCVVLAMMLGGFIPLALLFVLIVDDQPLAGWTCAGLAALIAIGGHAIVYRKLKPDYGS